MSTPTASCLNTCYTFAKAGNFAFFVISGLKYSIAHAQGLESNFNRFGVFVIPAIAFSVSDKVTLASHIGDGLYYNTASASGLTTSSNRYKYI